MLLLLHHIVLVAAAAGAVAVAAVVVGAVSAVIAIAVDVVGAVVAVYARGMSRVRLYFCVGSFPFLPSKAECACSVRAGCVYGYTAMLSAIVMAPGNAAEAAGSGDAAPNESSCFVEPFQRWACILNMPERV